MDRRQLLFGAAALGLVGQFNLNELLNAQSFDADSEASRAPQSQSSDREEVGLRGPVKIRVEQSNAYDRDHVITSEYTIDGQLLSNRSEIDGQLSYSSSDWVHTKIHDSQGRLAKFISGKRGERLRETLYSYDDAGRLAVVTNSENSDRLEYHYQADGSKTSIQTFDPKTIEQRRHGAVGSSVRDAAQMGFGVPMGGNVTTIYNSDDQPAEISIRTTDGQVVSRIVRTYDAEGRLIEEKPIEQNMALLFLDMMPPEQRALLSPQQVQAMNKGLNAFWKAPAGTTIDYDDQGRISKTVERNMFFEQTTVILYNEQGDKARERTTFKNNSTVQHGVQYSFDEEGNLIPRATPERPETSFPFKDTDVRSEYRYDSYGNWTERLETRADGSSVRTSRKLSYY
jgi:hypothetical protein